MEQFEKPERKKSINLKQNNPKLNVYCKHIVQEMRRCEYRTRKRKKPHSLTQYKDYLINARDRKFC